MANARRHNAIAALVAFALSSAALANAALTEPPKDLVGLVRLPTLFGQQACADWVPKSVALFARHRDRRSIGRMHVAKGWSFPPEGGCSGFEVMVHLHFSGPDEPLPTLEFGYEEAAGIVLQKSGAWCRIQLAGRRSAWIHRECDTGFMSVESLLPGKMLYLVAGALATAREHPAGPKFTSSARIAEAQQVSADLIEVRMFSGKPWLHVAASHRSICEGEFAPADVVRFWVPLRDPHGALQAWYYSRGC